MPESFDFLFNTSLVVALITFVAVSYLIVGLLTWSFIKPLKYLGIPVIVVGFISFGLKSLLEFAVKSVKDDDIGILKYFLDNCGSLLIKFAVISIIAGILMIVLYVILNKQLKARKREKRIEAAEERKIEKTIKNASKTEEPEMDEEKQEEEENEDEKEIS